MSNPVTERDFRKPEFLDAKIEDYERRADGAIVRKDRWEVAVRRIADLVGLGGKRSGFEIDDVITQVSRVVALQELAAKIHTPAEPQE